ncbi:MAG TPA: leucyl aminopeptidase family protein, partial [Gammaproteobacteria bacterium]
AASELRRVPQAAQLVKLLRRSGGKSVSTRLISARATALLLAPYSASSQFQSLSWAREVVATALRERPLKLGVVAVGLAEDARHAALTSLVAAAEAAAFELPSFKSDRKRKRRLAHLTLFDCSSRLDLGMLRAQALGNDIARWFTALPPNALTVSSYRAAVETLAKQFGISCRFLNETQLEKLGAGAFLAVSQGNKERDAGILHLRYRPRRQKAPDVAFVGKGILFDTGGTNLKPFKSMLDMHTDMQGSAVALGTLLAFASVEAPFAADAWLAVTPNRISAQSYTSQDIVTAANGTTIQVVHTDAEGRMVLADTLALASREEPALIIDYATLTGTCVMALTDRYSGTFSNRAAANALMRRAGAASGERVWPFPMDEDLEEPLKSEVADVKQCAIDGSGDHILAARFLSRFVPNRIPWVHIDLSSGQHKGGLAHVPSEITGFGVKLTLELLLANDPRALAAELGN